MARMSERLAKALDAVGATLKRDRKHLVYELPNGRTFVTSSTPSDKRADLNAIQNLKAVAGVAVIEERRKAAPEVRAERRQRPGRQGDSAWARVSPLAEALKDSGVVEDALIVRVEAAERWINELRGTQLALFDALADIGRMQAEQRAELQRIRSHWFVCFAFWLSPAAWRRELSAEQIEAPAAADPKAADRLVSPSLGVGE